jgi:hypothetical protein
VTLDPVALLHSPDNNNRKFITLAATQKIEDEIEHKSDKQKFAELKREVQMHRQGVEEFIVGEQESMSVIFSLCEERATSYD